MILKKPTLTTDRTTMTDRRHYLMHRHESMTPNSSRLLSTLAHTPFVERDELAAFAGLPPSSTLESLLRLEVRGHVALVRHTRSNTSRVRRWFLTQGGIMLLAEIRDTTAERLLRELPLSAEWRRILLRRLDAVASLYRVGCEIAACKDGPIEWRWQRTGAIDALLELPDGGAFALARLGPTLSWQAMRSRIGTLYGMQRTRRCPPALLLLPGNLEAQRLAADLRGRAIDAYAVSEHDVMETAPGSAVWRSLRDAEGFTLQQAISAITGRGKTRKRVQAGSERASMPAPSLGSGAGGQDLLATELTMPARRLLDALYDWPLMTSAHLRMLLDMSESPLKKARASLVKRGLVCQLRIGGTPERRQRNGTRLCLSTDGLRYAARRDRSRASDLIGRWGIVPDAEGDERLAVSGYRLEGSRLRVLARELRHTDGASDLVAMTAAECRRDEDWLLLQSLPPHRWERWFRHGAGWRSIRPDAVIELAHRGSRLVCLLEYEERARSPAPMTEKLARYRRYFESNDTGRDFYGGRATALFVFADETAASRFCALAGRTLRCPLPLLVSSRETIAKTGLLERAWRSPWQLQQGHMPLAAGL